jgi:hypothetical protein
VLFLIVPFVQESAGQVMLDMPIALFCFAALMIYVRYLETGRSAYAVLFALIAAAAMLTKGTGACLALVPPAAILIGRRFDLLRKFSFWLPLPIVALLTVPWYALTYERSSAGFRYGLGIDYVAAAITANANFLLSTAGPLVIVAALVAFADVARRGGANDARLTGAASLAAAVWLFQSIVPAAIQARYLIPILPPLFLLAGWGLRIIATWVSSAPKSRLAFKHAEIACATIILLGTLPVALAVEHKPHLGFDVAAQQVWSRYLASNPSVLIAANNEDEGRAIAELAMLDPARPSLFAIRGSRLLGGGGYNAVEYEPRFQTPQEVMAEIDVYNIPYVLIRHDPNPNAWKHIAQVEAARDLSLDRWQLVYRGDGSGRGILLYRIVDNALKPADRERLLALSAPRALTN